MRPWFWMSCIRRCITTCEVARNHEVEEIVIDDHLMAATATVDLNPPTPSGLPDPVAE